MGGCVKNCRQVLSKQNVALKISMDADFKEALSPLR
jgi:hypothetical protein